MSVPSDLPPDEARLRVLETFLVITLARVPEQLAHIEQQAAILRKSQLQAPPPNFRGPKTRVVIWA